MTRDTLNKAKSIEAELNEIKDMLDVCHQVVEIGMAVPERDSVWKFSNISEPVSEAIRQVLAIRKEKLEKEFEAL